MRRNARDLGLRGEELSRRRQVDFDLAPPGALGPDGCCLRRLG